MSNFIQSIAKARALTIGLGLLATTAPVFAQTTESVAPTATATAPATDLQARVLFAETVARYRALKNLSFAYSSGISANGSGNRNQMVQFSAPETLKITSLDDKGQLAAVQVMTPTETTIMQKPNDVFEYVVTPRPPLPAGQTAQTRLSNAMIGGLTFSSLIAGIDPFGQGGRFKSSTYALGTPTVEDGVALTPIIVTSPKTERQPTELTFTFFVNPVDHLLRRVETEVKSPDGTTRKLLDNFKSIQADAAPSAQTLGFMAPKGATKVDHFSIPAIHAKVGEAPLALVAGTKDIDGNDVTFDQFKGKVTLVDFWATWCGPCKGELPNVKANYAKYHDKGFDIVGISLDQSLPPLNQFIKAEDMPWRQVWDGYWTGPIATSFNVKAIPATILIGKDGKIAAIGARGEALEPAIQAALAAG